MATTNDLASAIIADFEIISAEHGTTVLRFADAGEVSGTVDQTAFDADLVPGGTNATRSFNATILKSAFSRRFPKVGERVRVEGLSFTVDAVRIHPSLPLVSVDFSEKVS